MESDAVLVASGADVYILRFTIATDFLNMPNEMDHMLLYNIFFLFFIIFAWLKHRDDGKKNSDIIDTW